MRLILVRHGQTESNVAHALDTDEPGASLTELGRSQAEQLVEAVAEEEISAIFTSNLARTHQTAAPLLASRGLRPSQDHRIREIRAGDLEMRNDDAAMLIYLSTVARWGKGDLDLRMPGGESGHEVLERYDAAIEAARATVGDATALFVSHGAIIRTWAAVRGIHVDEPWGEGHVLRNTGRIVLDDASGEWQIEQWHGFHAVHPPVRADAGIGAR